MEWEEWGKRQLHRRYTSRGDEMSEGMEQVRGVCATDLVKSGVTKGENEA